MMILYSGTIDPFSQRCRSVLYEKEVEFRIIDVDVRNQPAELVAMQPYDRVPVLVDRDLVLHEANIINEYVDARFLNPQLMPDDPALRARTRMSLLHFETELYANVAAIETGSPGAAQTARGTVRDNLARIAPMFAKQRYMLGDRYSMLDVAIAPLLWRLEHYRVRLPGNCSGLLAYGERLFNRPAFIDSLTASERAMRH
jgi:RNA polymerase-associated protein